MLNYFKRALWHPATHFNLLLVGVLIMIGAIHNYAHYSMEVDADSYVRNWCKNNLEECERFIDNDY